MLARLGPASSLSCATRQRVLSAVPYVLALKIRLSIVPSPPVSVLVSNLLLTFESGVGKLEGRTSHLRLRYCLVANSCTP